MNKAYKTISIIVILLYIGCDYRPTVIQYNSNDGQLSLINDTSLYIRSFYVYKDGNDSIVFSYPQKDDTLIRSQISLPDYFNIDKFVLENEKLTFLIRVGIKVKKRPFDVCYETINTLHTDSVFIFKCEGR